MLNKVTLFAQTSLKNLIMVAGHAIYLGLDRLDPEDDQSWALKPFQKGEPRYYIEHIKAGITEAERDQLSLLIFSGGQTDLIAGEISEAESYWNLAAHYHWWSHSDIVTRAITEDFARDSFENLLFSICRFKEYTGHYPYHIKVLSWAFKAERFLQHCAALRFPASSFTYLPINQPPALPAALVGEAKVKEIFREDPYGNGEVLTKKRRDRNPFNRSHQYMESCPELLELLQYQGQHQFIGKLPWD